MSIPRLFDVHTHVQFHAFKDDADLVMQKALNAGIWTVNVGTQKDTSEGAIKLAEKYQEGVYATVGLHPIHTEASYHDAKEFGASEDAKGFTPPLKLTGEQSARFAQSTSTAGFTSRGEDFDYNYYKKLAEHQKVVAIGECGLDYYRLEENTKEKQKKAFLQQINLAQEVKKPLMIHCRNAFKDLIEILKAEGSKLESKGIIHFFSGTKENAKELLDLGFSFSFGGVITFTRDYDEVVRYIPLERIVLETDAPYVAPVPHRGKRNEPFFIGETAKKLAELKNLAYDEAAEATTQNARKIFSV